MSGPDDTIKERILAARAATFAAREACLRQVQRMLKMSKPSREEWRRERFELDKLVYEARWHQRPISSYAAFAAVAAKLSVFGALYPKAREQAQVEEWEELKPKIEAREREIVGIVKNESKGLDTFELKVLDVMKKSSPEQLRGFNFAKTLHSAGLRPPRKQRDRGCPNTFIAAWAPTQKRWQDWIYGLRTKVTPFLEKVKS